MEQQRSSSNRSGGVCDAIVQGEKRMLGPLRLPAHRAPEFVSDFNRIYKGVGLKLTAIEPVETKKILGSPRADEDSSLDSQDS